VTGSRLGKDLEYSIDLQDLRWQKGGRGERAEVGTGWGVGKVRLVLRVLAGGDKT